jgi:hypothetical protein
LVDHPSAGYWDVVLELRSNRSKFGLNIRFNVRGMLDPKVALPVRGAKELRRRKSALHTLRSSAKRIVEPCLRAGDSPQWPSVRARVLPSIKQREHSLSDFVYGLQGPPALLFRELGAANDGCLPLSIVGLVVTSLGFVLLDGSR